VVAGVCHGRRSWTVVWMRMNGRWQRSLASVSAPP
jgi:hypothetical protein